MKMCSDVFFSVFDDKSVVVDLRSKCTEWLRNFVHYHKGLFDMFSSLFDARFMLMDKSTEHLIPKT